MNRKITFFLLWLSLSTAISYFLQLLDVPGIERWFLPNIFIVLIATLIHGPIVGSLVGVFGPVTSFLAVGWPEPAILAAMIFEGLTVGIVTSFLYRRIKILYPVILLSFLVSKSVFAILTLLSKAEIRVFADSFHGLVGLGLQLIFVPMVYTVLVKSSEVENSKGGI